MNDLQPQLSESVSGKVVLLHSGYGGGQYVGRVAIVISPNEPTAVLPRLVLEPESMRYQPRGSTFGGHDYQCFWQIFGRSGDHHDLHLKERDRLYLLGKEVDLAPFEKAKEPINPENPVHIKALIGESRELQLLYEGAPLEIVR